MVNKQVIWIAADKFYLLYIPAYGDYVSNPNTVYLNQGNDF